jgi:flagellar biosynthesis activator protein FlaF
MAPPAQKYARMPAPGNPAKTEAWALLEAARLMEGGKTKDKSELLDAVRRNWRLWTIFQASLIDAECTVPKEVRVNLLRLANFIDRHTAQILGSPDPEKIDVLVNINRRIGEGLLEGQRAAAAKAASVPPPPAAPQIRESV